MPNYDLKCPKCGEELELRRVAWISAKHHTCTCGTEMEIQIKPVLFKIKGKTIVID